MPQDTERGEQPFEVKTIGVESDELADFQVPKFVNSINISQYGQDVYLDMALLTVEQLNNLKPGAKVTVAVYDRLVMSSTVFSDFAKRAGIVQEQLKAEGLVRDEDVVAPKE
jgi:hypothetical protein